MGQMKSSGGVLHQSLVESVSSVTVASLDACGGQILRLHCKVAVISKEWERGCSQSKASADSDAPTSVPQITQQSYLPEDTIKETHQS